MKLCAKCRLEYNDNYIFCKRCGHKLVEYQSNKQNNTFSQKNDIESGNIPNHYYFIVLGIVVVLFFVGMFNFDDNYNNKLQNKDANLFLAEQQYGDTNESVKNKNTDKEDFKLFLKGAENGNAGAQYFVGFFYSSGRGVEINKNKAFKWFLESAKQGYSEAQYAVYSCYLNGDGVEKNEKEAFKWLLKIAENGKADAQYGVGLMYFKGEGVEKNENEAFKWFLKSAKQGYSEAQHVVGLCYLGGIGIRKDEKKGISYLLKAADSIVLSADNKTTCISIYYNLGHCYYYGKGVNEDLKKAEEWFTKAAELGDDKALNMLKENPNAPVPWLKK